MFDLNFPSNIFKEKIDTIWLTSLDEIINSSLWFFSLVVYSLEDADQLLPLTPNWISWTSFFNKVSSNILSEDNFVSPKIRVWIQYSYISSLRDTLAVHYQKGKIFQNLSLLLCKPN
jgi:hypothetical protein